MLNNTRKIAMSDQDKGINKPGVPRDNADSTNAMTHEALKSEVTPDTHYKSILDSLPDWVWEVDQNGYITYSNATVESFLGYVPRQIIGKSILSLVPQEKADTALELLNRQWAIDSKAEYLSHGFFSLEGEQINLKTTGTPFYDNVTRSKGFRFTSRLVEEESEHAISHFTTNNLNEAVVLMDNERKVIYINDTFTDIFGYTREEIIGHSIAELGTEQSLVSSVQEKDVTGALTRKNTVWQGEVLRKSKSGQYIPCLLSASALRDENNEITNFIGTYFDLRRMKHSDQTQKNALKATINAVCKAIDERNVLKGQHQDQVTDLAVAIAFEMGKDLSFIEGLTLASHLHDLGEMYIPPEIANKPGALSDADFELIKIHPIKGYEILKDIKFPWPVANIILQHHERINGSGYPKGLKGDEIMLEARILAVADMVCTMLTDRPFRPAYSMEQCIDELEINKGILYDERVVDVCLRLIREKIYRLKQV